MFNYFENKNIHFFIVLTQTVTNGKRNVRNEEKKTKTYSYLLLF